MTTVTIARPDGDMAAYVAVPEGAGPWPGVLVIQDALGMSDDLRRQVDWLAREGFLAVAPDLYYWGGQAKCMFGTFRAGLAGEGRVFADLEAARGYLTGREDCTGKVGVIGFCMGGGFALMLATNGRYAASSVNYGMVPRDAMTRLANSCPVVGSYGAKDLTLRGAPRRLEKALRANEVAHDIKVYADAGHAFMNDFGDTMPQWAVVMGKFMHMDYREESAEDARRRISAFFHEHLQT